jgi:hypothetical protein
MIQAPAESTAVLETIVARIVAELTAVAAAGRIVAAARAHLPAKP